MPKQIDTLAVNENAMFYSPIESDDVLVRTGTIRDECLYHCLMHSYSNEYRSMSIVKRERFINRLKGKIVEHATVKKWWSIQHGTIAFDAIQKYITDLLTGLYSLINGTNHYTVNHDHVENIYKTIVNDTSKLKMYKLITDLIPLDTGFNQVILPRVYKLCNNSSSIVNCKALHKEVTDYFYGLEIVRSIDSSKTHRILNSVHTMLLEVIRTAEKVMYLQ
jgi:hypothetical protein